MNIKLRRFKKNEPLDQLVNLRREIETFDRSRADTSEESLMAQFDWPNHQRWVIENTADKSLVGHAWSFDQSDVRMILQVFIHPACRREGMGSQLLNVVIADGQQRNMTQLVSGARAGNTAAFAFLEAGGFQIAGRNRFFEALADTTIDQPEWPSGFSIKSCQEIGDLSAAVEGSNACYADMWGHCENTEPCTLAHIKELQEKYPSLYQPAGIFAVYDHENHLSAVCFNRVEEGKKILDSPGVAPKYRHLNLWQPLVQHSMGWLNEQAVGPFYLHTWGDFDEAAESYYEIGFTLEDHNQMVEYLYVGK